MPFVNIPGGKKGEMSMMGVKKEIGIVGRDLEALKS